MPFISTASRAAPSEPTRLGLPLCRRPPAFSLYLHAPCDHTGPRGHPPHSLSPVCKVPFPCKEASHGFRGLGRGHPQGPSVPTTAGEGEGRQLAGQPQHCERRLTLPKQDLQHARSWESRNNQGAPCRAPGQQTVVQPHNGKAGVLPKRTAAKAVAEDVTPCRGKPT